MIQQVSKLLSIYQTGRHAQNAKLYKVLAYKLKTKEHTHMYNVPTYNKLHNTQPTEQRDTKVNQLTHT